MRSVDFRMLHARSSVQGMINWSLLQTPSHVSAFEILVGSCRDTSGDRSLSNLAFITFRNPY
jgi:hypothetical protein